MYADLGEQRDKSSARKDIRDLRHEKVALHNALDDRLHTVAEAWARSWESRDVLLEIKAVMTENNMSTTRGAAATGKVPQGKYLAQSQGPDGDQSILHAVNLWRAGQRLRLQGALGQHLDSINTAVTNVLRYLIAPAGLKLWEAMFPQMWVAFKAVFQALEAAIERPAAINTAQVRKLLLMLSDTLPQTFAGILKEVRAKLVPNAIEERLGELAETLVTELTEPLAVIIKGFPEPIVSATITALFAETVEVRKKLLEVCATNDISGGGAAIGRILDNSVGRVDDFVLSFGTKGFENSLQAVLGDLGECLNRKLHGDLSGARVYIRSYLTDLIHAYWSLLVSFPKNFMSSFRVGIESLLAQHLTAHSSYNNAPVEQIVKAAYWKAGATAWSSAKYSLQRSAGWTVGGVLSSVFVTDIMQGLQQSDKSANEFKTLAIQAAKEVPPHLAFLLHPVDACEEMLFDGVAAQVADTKETTSELLLAVTAATTNTAGFNSPDSRPSQMPTSNNWTSPSGAGWADLQVMDLTALPPTRGDSTVGGGPPSRPSDRPDTTSRFPASQFGGLSGDPAGGPDGGPDASAAAGPLRSGSHSVEFENGDVYDGDWHQGMMHGQGTYTYAETGDVYKGQWHAHNKHGFGMFFYKSSQKIYKGMFCNGVKHGRGVLTEDGGGKYEGTFQNGVLSGQGKYTAPNGDTYTGEFAAGQYEGYGVRVLHNGDRYEGSWLQGREHGKGTYTFKDGSAYVGSFANGVREGYGEYSSALDNSRYEGQWKNNLMHGDGKLTYPDDATGQPHAGALLLCQWKNNKIHGKGILTYRNGQRFQVEYSSDQCLSQTPLAPQPKS
eukprot:NODE_123_length_2720_cov_78.351554_g99_i0.p1 GENE.NODE_123_length_2720_cov_78.351554_g99_i0~~NODE_123_length_2720_cov_78.351554_g99_i0.p1  ORF type:complete len:892 (+),score=220.92 NODE_123_length_2720_cov_78.351554_g99_i0:171-2678(+)